MAVEDRDQVFEKALAQHLRRTSPNTSPVSGNCPDADFLAAYHENSLTTEQAAATKLHLATCANCQSVLEDLKATDEIPVSLPSPAATAPSPQSAGAGAVHVLKPRRAHLWTWIAPAGAIAAAVLVWVTVRDNPSLHKTAVTELTRTAAESAPAPTALQNLPESIAKAKPPEAAPLVSQLVSPSAAPRRDLAKSRLQAPADKKSAMAYSTDAATFLPNSDAAAVPRPIIPGTIESKSEELQQSRNIAAAPENEKLDAAANAVRQVTPAEPTREQQSAVVGGALAGRAGAPASSSRSLQKKSAAAAPPAGPAPAPAPAQDQQMDGMSRYKENAATVLARSVSLGVTTITPPSGSSAWRIGPGNQILYSADRGKTWTRQVTGASADLLAGSATAGQVCWLVGKAGTVLRTTDGGAHWQKLPPPTQDDLLSISAIDAHQATVSAAVGTYQTSDGGATWHRLPSE